MMTRIYKYIEISRPRHSIKNLIIFAPLFFTFQYKLNLYFDAFIIFFLFYLITTVTYIFNDLSDRNIDIFHPTKKYRPIAAGTVSLLEAKLLMLFLFFISTVASYSFNYELFIILMSYLFINILYSLKLKEIVFIDIIIISIGFILRLLAGSLVGSIDLSIWIFMMTFLLASLMAITKRKDAVDRNDYSSTSISKSYTKKLINYIVTVITLSIVIIYTLFAFSSEVSFILGNSYLPFTLIFVLLGISRYLFLIYNMPISYDPIEIFFNDFLMKLFFISWILSFFIISGI
ncbi:prenyltransferase [bacterium TMED221]|nr:MAG: prenyltransferase [bacterium TMED221]